MMRLQEKCETKLVYFDLHVPFYGGYERLLNAGKITEEEYQKKVPPVGPFLRFTRDYINGKTITVNIPKNTKAAEDRSIELYMAAGTTFDLLYCDGRVETVNGNTLSFPNQKPCLSAEWRFWDCYSIKSITKFYPLKKGVLYIEEDVEHSFCHYITLATADKIWLLTDDFFVPSCSDFSEEFIRDITAADDLRPFYDVLKERFRTPPNIPYSGVFAY